MKASELCLTRYEVIETFPGTELEIGDIILPIKKHGKTIRKYYECVKRPSCELIQYPEKYPHLFRALPWWEDRDIKDMPTYVMHHEKDIYKIKEWNFVPNTAIGIIDGGEGCVNLNTWNWKKGYGYIPIDENFAKKIMLKVKI